ncbi:MAG TPA: TonB-dependent receptor [Nitrospirota bacterium]|nr:TonB-dependent receptor [Nitrospirota bacterium]
MITKIAAGMAVVLAWLLSNGIPAAGAVMQMNEVVVTATKTEQKPEDVTQSVTVVTADEIAKSGATNVGDVLSTTVGATVTGYGPLGALQSLELRGSTYQQVLVLLDGMRLNSGSAGGYDLSELPVSLDAIERIEIVRGPASALYGSDAMGGVVNIITKKPTKQATTLSGALGADGYSSVSLSHSGKDGSMYYSLSYGKAHSSGFHHLNNNDDQYNAGIKLGYDFSAASSIEASADYLTKDIGVPGSTELLSPLARQVNRELVTGIQFKDRLSKAVDFNVRVYQTGEHLGYADPDPETYEFSTTRSMTTGAEAQVNWLMGTFSVLTLGVDGRDDNLVDSSAGTHTASLSAGYLQEELNLGDSFILILGDRYDKNSAYGSKWSPKASARYLIAGLGTILRASIGNSFRAPTLNDLYFIDEYGDHGNPNLRPETAVEYEGGIEQPLGAGNSIKFTAFNRRVEDLIVWEPTSPGAFTYIPMNIGRARISGTETELHFVVSQIVSGTINYALTFPVDETTGDRIFSDASHIPAQKLAGTLWVALDPKTSLSVGGQSVRNYVEPGSPKWDYYVLDGKITDTVVSQKDSKVQVFIGLKNIFNRQYETVQGYPMPPQEFYGGFTASF